MKSSARLAIGVGALALAYSPFGRSAAVALAQAPPPPAESAHLETQLGALLARPGGLTSEQAAARATATSYDVQARKADSDAAGAIVDQADAAYVPRVKGTASYQRSSAVSLVLGPIGTFSYPQNNWNLQVDVDVPISDYVLKIAKQHAAAEHGSNAAKLTERAAKATASSNARIQYYAWARARLRQVVAEDALELARAHAAEAKAELDSGKASLADAMAVDAQVAQNELLVVRAKNAAALEEDRLRTALHDSTDARYEIGEPLLADLAPMSGENDFNGLLGEALNERAELRSLGETALGQRAQAAAAHYDILPKLDGLGTAQYADPNPKYFPPESTWHGTWAVGGAITWSATDVLLGATNGSADLAHARSTEAQVMAMRDAIRDEVLSAWQSVHEAQVAIGSTQRSLASAEESYRVRRALFHAGRATSTELSDSENALTSARLDAVNARIDLRTARARLSHATGRDEGGALARRDGP